MGGKLFLRDRCDVLRRTASSKPYGSTPTYAVEAYAVPCRFTPQTKEGFNALEGEFVTKFTGRLQTAHDSPIRAGDKITNIVRYGGDVVTNSTGTALSFLVDEGDIEMRGHMEMVKMIKLKTAV